MNPLPQKGRAPSAPPIRWGAPSARARGPIIGAPAPGAERTAIGAHAGPYGFYRALSVAAGRLEPDHRADLEGTEPFVAIPERPSWSDPSAIVTLDPWGHRVTEDFREAIEAGMDVRPTIAITRARIALPEIVGAVRDGRLEPDGAVVLEDGRIEVIKASIEPVWHLPGIARRLGLEPGAMRRALYEASGGMYADLVDRPDLEVLLPPIGGVTAYLFGALTDQALARGPVAVRVHDECNGSDVFGSDICTCRPYLAHGIEACARAAQAGGFGALAYFRKEGRALGEVTKFLVYNARKRQPDGDAASRYFERTERVAGVQDARFQALMPDVLVWLGIERIDWLVSMSNLKYDAITSAGIEVGRRVAIPEELVPQDARVEIAAKEAAGYYTERALPDPITLSEIRGRDWS